MSEKKQIEDLTNKEILEDVEYYITQAQVRSPSFVDEIFDIIRMYTKELTKRKIEKKSFNFDIDMIVFLKDLHFNLNNVIIEKKVSMMIIKKIEELKGDK